MTAPDPAPRGIAAIERWLAGRKPVVLAAIVMASAAVRVAYFVQVHDGPLIQQHLWDQTDMNYFDAWARDIAGGDWLSRRIHPPVHHWHEQIAADYFRLRPEDEPLPAGGGAARPDRARAQALWERWCGGGRFYQDPLYAYLVALTYKAFGPGVRPVFVWQLAVGVLTSVLVWLVARQCFGHVAAALAGLMAVLYAPLLFYEMILLRDSLLVFAGLALVWLAGRQLEAGTAKGWLGLGLALGLALTLKSHFVLFLAGLAATVCLRHARRPRELGRALAPLVFGTTLGVAPAVARNVAVGVPPVGLASNGAVTFVLANAVDSGTAGWGLGHAAAILGVSQNRFLPAAEATLRTHPDAASYLRLLWRKFAATWHWYETPNNENFYYYRLHAGVLRALPFTFAAVAPLGAAGLLLALPRWRRCLALYLLVLMNLTVLVTSFVLSRYRVSLAAALIPFAALTLARLARWLESRRWAPALATVAGVGVLSLWTARPLPPGQTRVRVADVLVPYSVHYMPLINQAEQKGDWTTAAAIFRESLTHEPPEARALGPARAARGPDEAGLGQVLSRVHAAYARVLRLTGDTEAAAREEQRSRELSLAMHSMQSP